MMGSAALLRGATIGAATILITACGSGGEPATTPSPTDSESMSPSALAKASLLPASAVPPAPPGDSLVDSSEAYEYSGVIAEPSRQVMTCTPLEMTDVPGPPEPGAVAAAGSGFVTGVAQVDQYAVVYTDTAAARRAVERSRSWAEDCQTAFAVHAPGANAVATISQAPAGVDGFSVIATYTYRDTGSSSDEISAVLQSGPTVVYLRANESGAPADTGWAVDGLLDPAWSEQLLNAAADQLSS